MLNALSLLALEAGIFTIPQAALCNLGSGILTISLF